jgi:hypothetical protein
MASQIPSVGQWYRDMATNQFIEIIAVDEYSSVISIQYENAEIDELDLASWNALPTTCSNSQEERWELSLLTDQDRIFCDHITVLAGVNSTPSTVKPDTAFGWDDL